MAKTKIKTHRGAAKRFNLTKNGKVKMNKSFRRHILNKKDNKEKETFEKASLLLKGKRSSNQKAYSLQII